MGNNGKIVSYDVRGIQDYIFRTDKVKEIIGASEIIDKLIFDGLRDSVKKWKSNNKSELIVDLTCDSKFDKSKDVVALFIGGGNATVYYKNEQLAKEISEKLSVYVLDHTYSLNLAVAMTDMTSDNYNEVYLDLMEKMRTTKSTMPYCKPIGAFPLCKVEDSTGLPIYKGDKSRESKCKIKAFNSLKTELDKKKKESSNADNSYEKLRFYDETIIDNMVREEDNSLVAVIHIDGNNMGDHFAKAVPSDADFDSAVQIIRDISKKIDESYQNAFDTVLEKLKGISENSLDEKYKDRVFIRRIIRAGDDISYIINAKFAFDSVKVFLEEVEKCGKSYSACAGIAFCHSHFPFSNAYRVAEELCSNAKKRAKHEDYTIVDGDKKYVRSAVDFQILSHMNAAYLDDYREKQFKFKYEDKDYNLLRRPYILDRENDTEKVQQYSFNAFLELLKSLKNEKLTRSDIKDMRNAYHKGNAKLKILESKYASRKKLSVEHGFGGESEDRFFDNQRVAYYYDAYEIFDHYVNMDKLLSDKEANTNENDL